jgi:hypothetical protein
MMQEENERKREKAITSLRHCHFLVVVLSFAHCPQPPTTNNNQQPSSVLLPHSINSMGDQQSTQRHSSAAHGEDDDDSLLPIERTWQNAWRYEAQPDSASKFQITIGGHTFKYSDTRIGIVSPLTQGNVVLEIFWEAEMSEVRNVNEFVQAVASQLQPLLSSASFSFPMREGGCMIPLVAVPVEMSVDDATRFGEFLFKGFGGPYPEKRPQNPHHARDNAPGQFDDDDDGDSSAGSFSGDDNGGAVAQGDDDTDTDSASE